MKLDELLHKCTPLPYLCQKYPDVKSWTISDKDGSVASVKQEGHARMLCHSANTLPELVAAARALEFEILSHYSCYEDMPKQLEEVMLNISSTLARAENVEDK